MAFKDVVTWAVAILLLHRICLILYRIYLHPLSKYPGPKYLAASAFPRLYYQELRGDFFKDVRDLHDQYGSIVRVAPNELSIDGSIGWEDTYGHKKAGQLEFPKDLRWYRPVDDGHGNHDLLMANLEDHRRQRRLVAHAFSDSALSEQEGIIKSYIDTLMRQLKENASQGTITDIVTWYNYTTFDIIGDLAFGDPFHCLETTAMRPWVHMVFRLIKIASRIRVVAQYPIMMILLPFIVEKGAMGKIAHNKALTSAKLDKRLALGTDVERKDFLSYILRHNDEKAMNRTEILANAEAFIGAGSETTATQLSGLTYLLSQNPEAWLRLKTEIRGSFNSEDELTLRSTAGMPYLCACVDEGMRAYPPVATTPPRVSPGATVNGEFIPKGTKIWIHQWSTNHRSSNFALPDTFAPERWLPSSHSYYDPKFKSDNRACVRPFSVGPRNCIGKNLAYGEIRLILARMVWNFDLEIMPESMSWLEGQKVFTVYEKPPLLIKLHKST